MSYEMDPVICAQRRRRSEIHERAFSAEGGGAASGERGMVSGGALAKYRAEVSSASEGAVTTPPAWDE